MEKLSNQRMDALIGKLEEATTDGDLSDLTQDDIGDIYLWMSARCGAETECSKLISKLKEIRRMGEQKDDSLMVNQAQALLTMLEGL